MEANTLGTLAVDTSQGRLEITVSVSEVDGAVVVGVDTPDWEDGLDAPDIGPQLRIWLNDYLMHQGVKLPA
tara:strand:- start:159 stop:371 length:213 start_codon:yes stop_codon:yes gene_type:complete